MPSFVDVITGALAKASDVQQIIDALKGTAGKGIPLSLTSVNDAINFALSVKNNDATASKTAVFYKADGTVLFQIDKNGVIASADGTTSASQIPTLTGTQSFTNKSTSYISGQGNTLTVPASRVFNNAAISIPNNVFTSLTFNTERYKTDAGMHSTVTNTSRLVATVAGKYRITGAAEFATNATGIRALQLLVNGVTGAGIAQLLADAGHFARVQVTSTWPMAVNDYVELQALQDSGAALNVNANAGVSPEFWMELVGA